MTATNVPPIVWLTTGLQLPSASAVLAGAQADINQAFGGNLNATQLSTPQGQLASSETAIITANNDLFLEFVNQVDPDNASGFMQDAIARIYFLDRIPGAPTSVLCLCIGLSGVVIPIGAQASDTSGNLYVCQQTGTIPISGQITLPFACTVNGPTACPAGTLINIYQQIPGWDTISNPAPGVAGQLVETQAAFAYRRNQSVALNAQGAAAAIYANVLNVPGVLDAYVYENNTSAVLNVGSSNYPMAPNSVYVAAIGGVPQAIGQAIWQRKNLGCNYNGNTTVSVTDPNLPASAPAYSVSYNIPTPTAINFAVQIANSPGLPSNITALVQAAIVSAFTGVTASRVRIGSLLLASSFYAPILAIGPYVQLLSVFLAPASVNVPTFTSYQFGIDQAPTTTAANITVTRL